MYNSLLICITEKCSVVRMYHHLFFNSPVEHLACSQVGVILSRAAMEIYLPNCGECVLLFLLGKYRGLDCLQATWSTVPCYSSPADRHTYQMQEVGRWTHTKHGNQMPS